MRLQAKFIIWLIVVLQIHDFPTGYFTNNRQLKIISARENNITTLGDIFGPLQRLLRLTLSHNRISMIVTCAFAGLSALTTLDLRHNFISQIDLSGLGWCIVHLEYNGIHTLEDLQGLPWAPFDMYDYEIENHNKGKYQSSASNM